VSEVRPKLWSDFDGTAVALAKKTDPRNWSKYPLKGLVGYADFLRGVQSTGVEIAGVVSRRPDIFIRRMATARSITKLGLGELFTNAGQIVHKGSEEAKGRFVAEQSRETTVGMLEDKPHKLGAVLLGMLDEPVKHPEATHHPIILGVVSHSRSQEYIERLAEQAKVRTSGDLYVTEFANGVGTATTTGITLEAETLTLRVVPLQPYSQEAGQSFGQMLTSI